MAYARLYYPDCGQTVHQAGHSKALLAAEIEQAQDLSPEQTKAAL